ncbi:arabinose efflux permease [Enemella evansiae]|uniref:MFS transporter n=1 Tax=Enemella evansiae TaxID=2016499 RepID=UPI000B96F9B1|nr:MFS transporter [Enemella evansiae]OYN95392.1 arabinose efflux permease [Enemella evansiae]
MIKQIFWPVLAPAFLYQVGSGALTPVVVLAALSLGAGHALAGGIVTAMGVAAIIASIPAGRLVDRLGDRNAMGLATVLVAVLTTVAVLVLTLRPGNGVWLFTGAIVLIGATEVVWSLARQALVAETVPPQRIAMAMTSLGGAARAGQLVGPALGALLLLRLPLQSVFVLHIVAALAATVLIWRSRFGAPTARPARPAYAEHGRRPPKLDVRWKAVALAGVSMVTLSMARQGKNVVVPLWGDQLQLSPSAISLLVALGSAIELLLIVPGGILKDRMGRTSVLVTCLLLLGVGFAIVPLAPTVWVFVVGLVILSIGNGLGSGINMTLGADLSPPVGRARFLGYWTTLTQAGAFAGPGLVTAVVAAASLSAAVWALAAAPLFGAVWLLCFQHVIGLPSARRARIERVEGVGG